MDEPPPPTMERMPWLDRKKGKLDYVLAGVPLMSLIFVVVAYFHTVHPHFTRQQELTQAMARVAELEDALGAQQRAAAESNAALQDTSSRLHAAQLQARYLAERLRDALPEGTLDEIQRTALQRFYSTDAVVQAYADFENATSGAKEIDVADVKRQSVQAPGTNRRFLLLTHPGFCGSGGCTGPLFEEEFGSYCFVVWAHSRTVLALAAQAPRRCAELSHGNWLDDIANAAPEPAGATPK
jgi:uncharacterized coiled-coil protein SlyX